MYCCHEKARNICIRDERLLRQLTSRVSCCSLTFVLLYDTRHVTDPRLLDARRQERVGQAGGLVLRDS